MLIKKVEKEEVLNNKKNGFIDRKIVAKPNSPVLVRFRFVREIQRTKRRKKVKKETELPRWQKRVVVDYW